MIQTRSLVRSLFSASALFASLAVAGCADDVASPTTSTDPATEVRYDSLGRQLGPITTKIVVENERAGGPTPLARIEVQRNEIVEFYDFAGRVMISAAGAPDGRPVQADALAQKSVAALWSDYSKGAQLPTGLSTAIANRRPLHESMSVAPGSLKPALSALPAAPAAAGFEQKTSALDTGFCATSYYTTDDPNDSLPQALGGCSNQGGYWNPMVCWDNVVGNGSAWDSEVRSLRSNVCPRSGSVIAKFTADESGPSVGSWTVGQNSYRWWYFFDSDCDLTPFDDCPYIKGAITSVGVTYNFRYFVHES